MSYHQLPVVIDSGSGVIKAGLAGSREPQFVYPDIVGRAKGPTGVEGAQEVCVGDQAEQRRNSLSIRYRLLPAGGTRWRGRRENPEAGPRLEKGWEAGNRSLCQAAWLNL